MTILKQWLTNFLFCRCEDQSKELGEISLTSSACNTNYFLSSLLGLPFLSFKVLPNFKIRGFLWFPTLNLESPFLVYMVNPQVSSLFPSDFFCYTFLYFTYLEIKISFLHIHPLEASSIVGYFSNLLQT